MWSQGDGVQLSFPLSGSGTGVRDPVGKKPVLLFLFSFFFGGKRGRGSRNGTRMLGTLVSNMGGLVGHTVPWSPRLVLTLPFPRIPPEHKVIIVGLDNAGKSTILYQFLMNEVVHTCPTIGSNVEEIVLRKTHFLMWDIGGQEALRSTWNTYYSNTEFIILVIDSTDRDRLLTTREELYKMLAHEAARWAPVDAVSGHCQLMS
ncbi:putative ADP-ribosylation factor-like protein 5C isoform X2 [Desmodus rotundus]|uniref:putative ADP-ribosylation factor-like protein 5C isoform X2 n=1 Tax=Desmodus rotundus TaxID=9430 RepID=UPI002381294C|nr:putative ADP-ribosylation factor-like protein 5C isoform X2 [Desmodus rotundus]